MYWTAIRWLQHRNQKLIEFYNEDIIRFMLLMNEYGSGWLYYNL